MDNQSWVPATKGGDGIVPTVFTVNSQSRASVLQDLEIDVQNATWNRTDGDYYVVVYVTNNTQETPLILSLQVAVPEGADIQAWAAQSWTGEDIPLSDCDEEVCSDRDVPPGGTSSFAFLGDYFGDPPFVIDLSAVYDLGDGPVLGDEEVVTVEAFYFGDIRIDKEASPEEVGPDDDLLFTITVINGQGIAGNAFVEDTLPPGFEPTTYTSTKGSCALLSNGYVIQCSLGDMGPEEVVTITIRGKWEAPHSLTSPLANPMINKVQVASDLEDLDLSNNSATAEVRIQPFVDVTLEKELVEMIPSTDGRIIPGGILIYRLTITVDGALHMDATDVVVEDVLPPGVTFISGDEACTYFEGGHVLRCELGSMNYGESKELMFSVKVRPDAEGSLLNRATASSITMTDGKLLNNTDEVTVEVKKINQNLQCINAVSGTNADKIFQEREYDFYIDETRIAESIGPGQGTPKLSVEIGGLPVKFDIVNAGASDNTDPVWTREVDFSIPTDTTTFYPELAIIVLTGTPDNLYLVIERGARLSAQEPGLVDVLLTNAVFGSEALDIKLLDNIHEHSPLQTLADDLPYEEVTPYLSLEPVVYNVEVSSADNTLLYDVFGLDLGPYQGKTVVGVLASDTGSSKQSDLTFSIFDTTGTVASMPVLTALHPQIVPIESFILRQNHPNPFRNKTTISYTIPESTWTQIAVYDILGRQIQVLVNEEQTAGAHTVTWDGQNDKGESVASGLYFYRMKAGGYVDSHSMLMIK